MDVCGLCCAKALTWWWHDEYDLDRYLCGHHSDDRADEMVTTGWVLMSDERLEQS